MQPERNFPRPDAAPNFALDHSALAADQRFARMAEALSALSPIDSEAKFDRYCRDACRIWVDCAAHVRERTGDKFARRLAQVEHGGKHIIRTSWGGVVVTRHEHPEVEKYLVIRQGGYLALEKHEKKDERLEVKQGAGLILWRKTPGIPLAVEILQPGSAFYFSPGREHCLIGTENLLVFEQSTDPKGMDQDLIFLYEPDGVTAPAEAGHRHS